jgi:putative MATE family efflux protein
MIEDEAPPALDVAAPSVRARVLRLATPVIGENLLQTAIGIIDTLFVARLGADALAGVGTAIQVLFFVISSLTAVAIGSSILVSHSIGADALAQANRVARQSIVWSLLLALPLMALGASFAFPLARLFGATASVTAIAGGYLQITLATSILLVVSLACSSVLRGAGDTRTPMLATLLANAVNAVAAWALIFGHLGLPALGPNGSAWAASIGRAVAAALLVALLWRGRAGITIRGRSGWWPRWSVARRVLGLGVPAAVEQVLISAAFTALTILIVRLGTDALAAQRVAGNAMSVSLLPGFGFAIATTTLVGQSLGAGRPRDAQAAANEATRWAILWMTTLGAAYFFAGAWIMRAFTDDPAVIALGTDSLKTIALIQPAWAVILVLTGGLRGAGNTRFPLLVNASSIWLSVLLGWAAVSFLGHGLYVAWLGFPLIAPLAALVVVLRFRRGDWQQARLVGHSGPHAVALE